MTRAARRIGPDLSGSSKLGGFMRLRLLLTLPAIVLAGPLAGQGTAGGAPAVTRLDSASTIADGRKYTAWFYGGLGDSLIAHSSAAVKEKVTAAQLNDLNGQLVSQVGNEESVVSERVVGKDSLSGYLREAKFEQMDEPLVIVFTLGRAGEIYGFFIRPKSQVPPDESK
jgi:hypothetical protein